MFEGTLGHETLELGGAHLLDMHELHVSSYHIHHIVDDAIGIAQTIEDGAGHFCTHAVMPIEADTPRFIERAGEGLAPG